MQGVVGDRRRVGGLAEDAFADRRHAACPVDALRRVVQRQDRVVRPDGVGDLVGRERLGVVLDVLTIVERAGDVLDLRRLADDLKFLAVFILLELRQAVAAEVEAGEVAGRADHGHRGRTVVVLALGKIAVGRDRLQSDGVGDLPVEGQPMAPGRADAGLFRHADIGDGGAAGLDRRRLRQDQRARRDELLIQRRGRVARVVIGILGVEIRGRGPHHAGVDAALVEPAELVGVGQRVLHPAVAGGDDAVQLEGEVRNRRQVEVNLALVGVIVSGAGRGRELELSAGLLGHDVDRAALGIPAEQRALRALQDFDAVDVVEG